MQGHSWQWRIQDSMLGGAKNEKSKKRKKKSTVQKNFFRLFLQNVDKVYKFISLFCKFYQHFEEMAEKI